MTRSSGQHATRSRAGVAANPTWGGAFWLVGLLAGCGATVPAEFEDPGRVIIEQAIGPLVIESGQAASPPLTATYRIENPTAETMHLTLQHRSCLCAGFSVASETIAPGGSTTITVNAQPHLSSEEQHLTLVFGTGLADPAEIELRLHVTTIESLQLLQQSLPFVEVAPGEIQRIPLEVRTSCAAGETPEVPDVVATAGESVQVRRVGSEPLRGPVGIRTDRHRFELVLTCPEDVSSVGVRNRAEFRVSAGRQRRTVSLDWSPAGSIRVEPRRVFLNVLAQGGQRQVTLRAADPFAINSIQTSSEKLQARAKTAAAATEQILEISARSHPEAPQTWIETVDVTTDHESQPKLRFEVYVLNAGGS